MKKIGPKVFVATEVRVYKVNGHYYADSSFSKILERYSENFGKIILATRIIKENKKRDGYKEIDNFCFEIDNIKSIPNFLFRKTSSDVLKHIKESDLIVLRLHSLISLKMYRLILKFSKKYMVEVVGCAWGSYWNHSILGKMIAPFVFFKTRRIVRNADYCLYVTESFLQRRYPCSPESVCVGVSDVDIRSVTNPKKYDNFNRRKFSMMTAGALNVKYKGQKYVIKAIRKLKDNYGMDITYYLAGKGDNSRLKKIVKKNKLEKNVVFLGMISREELEKYMRKVDFYVQPSLLEGLPRALVEAMSYGDVCLGSNVGGIPELLSKEQIFKKKSTQAIVNAILDMVSSNRFSVISAQNVEKAKKYLSYELEERRMDFFEAVKKGIMCSGEGEKKMDMRGIT